MMLGLIPPEWTLPKTPPVARVGCAAPAVVRRASPLAYRVQLRPRPETAGTVAFVRGRPVHFRPTPEYDHVSVQAVGRDGTVLLRRWSYGLYTTSRQSIVRGRVETPVVMYHRSASLDHYLDARNFAGEFYDDDTQNTSDMMPPAAESYAFVVERGVPRIVGRGTVTAWKVGGTVATTVHVDAQSRPAGYEASVVEHTQVLEKGRAFDLGPVRFVGRGANGALVLADVLDRENQALGIYLWRGKRLLPWATLPSGWEAVTTDGQGRLLARKERSLAILRGRSLHPLRFAPPPGWNDLAWDEDASFSPGGAFRIDANQGMSATPVAVFFTPR